MYLWELHAYPRSLPKWLIQVNLLTDGETWDFVYQLNTLQHFIAVWKSNSEFNV